MRLRFPGWIFLLLASALAAQEIPPERGSRKPDPGTAYRWIREIDRTESRTLEVDGQIVHRSNHRLHFSFTAHVEVDEETPGFRRITFVRATLQDQAGEEIDLQIADRTIRVPSSTGDGPIRFENGTRPTDDQRRFLTVALEPEIDLAPLLPDRPVSPGERWKTSLSRMLAPFGLEWDEFDGDGFLAESRFETIDRSRPEPIARFRSEILDPPDQMDGKDLIDSKLAIRILFTIGTEPESCHRSIEGDLSFAALAIHDADESEIVTETKTDFRLRESIDPRP